ncbi:hypothetical protein BCV70DRAFT_217823 [Testicularia cyperi]|uniref:Uncharacterized protein n=1 Tax=Testicularia cyperi TaxID=1882483 RepID=A0A317XNK8_9BASI|nr:hypothetical protein BCV70DRAFT_217823 [Testicularia cyperi]
MGVKHIDEAFNKPHQTVGAPGNRMVDNLDEKIWNEALIMTISREAVNEEPERDLEFDGYTTRQTVQKAPVDADLKKKLDKRGNQSQ